MLSLLQIHFCLNSCVSGIIANFSIYSPVALNINLLIVHKKDKGKKRAFGF